MATPRAYSTGTLLPDGRVLVAGGARDWPETTAELFDPRTGSWAPTGAMGEARARHTATLLLDGRVLVVGGTWDTDGVSAHASAELFDPASGTWSVVRPMAEARANHSATLLDDGRILVVGGSGPFENPTLSPWLATAEVFDVTTGRWSPAGTMQDPMIRHSATRLGDGRVLVAGGVGSFTAARAAAERFDPVLGTWAATHATIDTVFDHQSLPTADGAALVVGGIGRDLQLVGATERFDPGLETWTSLAPVTRPREGHTVTLFDDGTVLVVGGSDVDNHLVPEAEWFGPA
jgi:hypothetical protein